MAEELLINVGVGGDSVTKLATDVDKLGTEVTDTAKSFDKLATSTKSAGDKQESLRAQIRKGREELAGMTRGTAEYASKLADVASKQATFNRINKELKASQATLGQTMSNVNNVVGGLAGGFSVATGVMNLFGIENESAMKSLVKMQALMSITSGLASLNTAMRSFDGLKAVFGDLFKSGKIATDAVSELNMVNGTAAASAGTLAKESAVIGSNMAGVGAATQSAAAATTSAAAATDALVASQIASVDANALIISSNSTLEEQYLRLSVLEKQFHLAKLTKNDATLRALNTQMKAQTEAIAITESTMSQEEVLATKLSLAKIRLTQLTLAQTEAQTAYNLAVSNGAAAGEVGAMNARLVNVNRSIEMQKQSIIVLEEKIIVQNASTVTEVENTIATDVNTEAQVQNTVAQENVGKAAESNSLKILKQIGMLAVYAAVIYGVIAAVTWLIKEMNKIPKDLELKIKLSEDAEKGTAKARTLIKEIQHDLDIISTKHNDNKNIQLNAIKEVMVKEGMATKEQLKNLDARGIADSTYFKNYLKKVENAAYDEALIKLRVEEQVKLDTAKMQLLATEESMKITENGQEELRRARIWALKERKGEISAFEVDATLVQEAQKWTDLNRNIDDANKNLKLYNSLKFKGDYLIKPTPDTKGGVGSKSSTSVSSSGGDYKTKTKELEQYTKDFDVTYTQYIDTYAGLTQEENAIRANQMLNARRDRQLTLSEQLRQDKAVIDGRLQDLNMAREAAEKEIELKTGTRNAAIAGNKKIINDLDIQFNSKKAIYNKEIVAQNELNKNIENLEVANELIADDANKSKSESYKKSAQERIKANNLILDTYKTERDAATDSLAKQLKVLDELQVAKTKAETELAAAIESGADISGLQTKIDEINGQIIDASADAAQNVRDSWEAAFEGIQIGLEKVGNTLSSLSNINDLMMTTIDNKTNHEKNSLELSDKYQKASSEEQTKMMYDLDKKNYDSKVKLFETKKLYDIGVVTVETISGGIAAVTQGVKQFGPVAGGIIGGIEAAVIAAGGIAAIAEIKSRTLDAPIPPNSGGGDAATSTAAATMAGNIALNPSKTTLTSKEENLNMMNKSGQLQTDTIVKVSDINKVQATVKTRENNSSY